jgi:hypothetical protein
MKSHRPWRPHLDSDPLFNPFVPTTVHRFVDEGVELAPADEEEGDEPAAAEGLPDQPAEEAK